MLNLSEKQVEHSSRILIYHGHVCLSGDEDAPQESRKLAITEKGMEYLFSDEAKDWPHSVAAARPCGDEDRPLA